MKYLIIRLSSLGDIMLTEPVTRAIKEAYPAARIDYLTKPEYLELVQHFQSVDNILLWSDKRKLFQDLKRRKYDIIIDLQAKFNTFLIKMSMPSSQHLTYKKHHFQRWLRIHQLSRKAATDVVELYLQVLSRLSITLTDQYPRLQPGKKSLERVRARIAQADLTEKRKKVAIFPGAQHFSKQYPLELWAEFINQVPPEWECDFLFLGSDKEKGLTAGLQALTRTPSAHDWGGMFSLCEIIALLSLMDAVITNDSGIMHLAAALQKPQIAIFGATHTDLGFKPRNQKAVILQANLSCQPCSLHGSDKCRFGTLACFRKITPSSLRQNLAYMLSRESKQ